MRHKHKLYKDRHNSGFCMLAVFSSNQQLKIHTESKQSNIWACKPTLMESYPPHPHTHFLKQNKTKNNWSGGLRADECVGKQFNTYVQAGLTPAFTHQHECSKTIIKEVRVHTSLRISSWPLIHISFLFHSSSMLYWSAIWFFNHLWPLLPPRGVVHINHLNKLWTVLSYFLEDHAPHRFEVRFSFLCGVDSLAQLSTLQEYYRTKCTKLLSLKFCSERCKDLDTFPRHFLRANGSAIKNLLTKYVRV